MHNRKAIFFLLFIFSILIYSRLSAGDPTSLPNARDINGNGLANIPPVNDAIDVFQNRLKQNPNDAVSYTLLGGLYLRQARETGDATGYQRAEAALKKSLELLPGYSPAGSALASSYYSQHNFDQALELANRVYESNPKDKSALVTVADAQLALGKYAEAEKIYTDLANTDVTPPLLARIASLEELKGEPEHAIDLMSRAAAQALRSGGTRESVAWYVLRLADLYYNIGDLKKADDYYEAALRVFDNYYLAFAGLGKVRAAEGKYDEAISYYQKAVDIIPQPEFLAALGDLYMVTNQPKKAQAQYKTVEYIGKLAALNQQIYNRQLANFYSDHDLYLDEALQLALTELKSRKDVYGYDAAAWAYYKNGNYQQAQQLIDQAMLLGTRDTRLYYHAGMIALQLDNKTLAQKYLEQALAINPNFSILHSAEAHKTLSALQTMVKK